MLSISRRAAAFRRDLVDDRPPERLERQGHIAVAVRFEGVSPDDGRHLLQPLQNLGLAPELGDLLTGRILRLQRLNDDIEAV